MRFFKGFLVAACLFATPVAAQAQITEQTADEIRRAIKVWIGQNVQPSSGTALLEFDGPITVIPEGDHYAVTIPAYQYGLPDLFILHSDLTTIQLRPLPNGWFDVLWRTPDNYRVSFDGRPDTLITVDSQTGSGVFAPEFMTVISADTAMEGIVISGLEENGSITIDSLTAVVTSTEVSEGRYDQISSFDLNQLTVSSDDGRDLLELGGWNVQLTTDNASLADIAEFQYQTNAMTREIEMAQTPEQLQTLIQSFADLLDSLPPLFARASMVSHIGPVTFRDHGEWITIEEGTYSVVFDGMDQARSQIEFALGSDGMATNDQELARLIPAEFRFRLGMVDLPNTELVQLAIDTLRAMETADPQMALLMATGSLQQALTMAGSTLEIGPIRLASDIASIDIEGTLRPETRSPYSVAGQIDMVATGLDALVAELQRTGGDQSMIQNLTILQSMGARAPDADGRTVFTYAFRLDESGTLLLNGLDLMPLITGAQ